MTISSKTKNNVKGFDFTSKTFTELYDFFEGVASFRNQTQVYDEQNKYLKNYKFVNAVEKDNKEYPVAIMEIYMEELNSGCWYTKHLIVSPFTCYLLPRGSYKNPNDIFKTYSPDNDLTSAFRQYMLQNYGEQYVQSCKQYITTCSEFEKSKLKKLYESKLKTIKAQEDKELELLGDIGLVR